MTDMDKMMIERAKVIQERLRRKVHRGKYMPGGGTICADGTATMWGGEKFMEYANDDGPQAAALIDELLAAYNPDDRLREALEWIAENDWFRAGEPPYNIDGTNRKVLGKCAQKALSALSPLPQGDG